MSFSDQMDADLAVLTATTGEFSAAVTYTPASGDPVSIRAIVPPKNVARDDLAQSEHIAERNTIAIRTDATAGVAAPAVGDSVTIASEEWAVDEVELVGAGAAVLHVTKLQRTRIAGPDSRMARPG